MRRVKVELPVPVHGLVVVAGIPGAGKSTLLARAENEAGAKLLDSDQVRAWFSRVLPPWVRYRWYRPLVHLGHRSRILLFSLRRGRAVVAHEPATRASTRLMLIVMALLAGRSRHLLWVHTTPGEAAAGQRARGRVLAERSFTRHVQRAAKVERALADGCPPRGWHTVEILERPPLDTSIVLRSR
ncbi:AAA family ATPase [Amycolatopsis magusensis]|uniref:AAA family ATPase n=1 Tax=Amycolatopsis magusensis TaxID=882444 RepID=UPI00379838A9